MLIALNSQDERTRGADAIRQEKYHCQQCGQQVMAKKGNIMIHHFAHYPGSPSCVWWEPESEEHLAMKDRIMQLLTKDNATTLAEFEYKLNHKTYDLYPDVYVELADGKRIAVECQISSKPLQDFVWKTLSYSDLGVYTLWLFPDDDYESKECDDKAIMPSIIRLRSHKWNYGRIYTLSDQGLRGVHFSGVSRLNEWTGVPHYLKKKKNILIHVLDNARLLCVENGYLKIARFYDKKWWGA